MYAGSAFVQAIMRTDMDLTKEIEQVREQRRLARQIGGGATTQKPQDVKAPLPSSQPQQQQQAK